MYNNLKLMTLYSKERVPRPLLLLLFDTLTEDFNFDFDLFRVFPIFMDDFFDQWWMFLCFFLGIDF